MRRVTIIIVLVALVAGGAVVIAAKPELLAHIGLGGDSTRLRELTRSFVEDVQFKDFKRAARYHKPEERSTVDIPFLIERLFLLKPEQLDIMEHEILFSKIDSTGLRGRTKTRIKVKDLVNEKIRIRELMLYFYRDDRQSPWFMRLETSLRTLRGDPDKKHKR
jgi:hypothetical protein